MPAVPVIEAAIAIPSVLDIDKMFLVDVFIDCEHLIIYDEKRISFAIVTLNPMFDLQTAVPFGLIRNARHSMDRPRKYLWKTVVLKC